MGKLVHVIPNHDENRTTVSNNATVVERHMDAIANMQHTLEDMVHGLSKLQAKYEERIANLEPDRSKPDPTIVTPTDSP